MRRTAPICPSMSILLCIWRLKSNLSSSMSTFIPPRAKFTFWTRKKSSKSSKNPWRRSWCLATAPETTKFRQRSRKTSPSTSVPLPLPPMWNRSPTNWSGPTQNRGQSPPSLVQATTKQNSSLWWWTTARTTFRMTSSNLVPPPPPLPPISLNQSEWNPRNDKGRTQLKATSWSARLPSANSQRPKNTSRFYWRAFAI